MAILPELLIASPTLQDFLIGKDGLPLAAGTVTCYQDNSRTTLKNWYYQSGTPLNYNWIALPNPLTLSAAGTIQDALGNDVIPFFYPWFVDSSNDVIFQPYFITVYDSNGELQFTRANFPFVPSQFNPPIVNDIFTLENYVINNRFWRNIGSLNAGTLVPNPTSGVNYVQTGDFGLAYNDTPSPPHYYYATLAPSQNDGFSMPDFTYIKNAQGGIESISFLTFPPSSTPALTGDVMPEFYVEHICSSNDVGVSLKVYQIPIALHLDNLAGQEASVSIQAKSTSSAQITLSIYQFQGTGNTSFQPTPFYTVTLGESWQKYSANFIFPSNLDVVPSTTGDDAWYLQIGMPLTTGPFEVDFTLPSLYLNPLEEIPTNSFESYDQIDAIISKPRTGDIRTSINNLYPYGWLPMNGGTIGNSSSNATLRRNVDAWPLYNLLWNNFSLLGLNGNPLVPIYTSGGDPSIYGANSVLDWEANKAIAMTQTMGRVLLGTVPNTALLGAYTTTYNSAPSTITTTSNVSFFNGMPVYISGTPIPTGLTVNTIYYVTNFNGTNNFSLATTFANSLSGTIITIGTIVGSTAIITSALSGTYEGEYAHVQLQAELATHSHPGSTTVASPAASSAGLPSLLGNSGTHPVNVAPDGSSSPFNITQPGTFTNIYIKL
jgi:hypothetical protein